MTLTAPDFEQLAAEHRTLLSQYGRVQSRCSEVIAAQARSIDALQGEVIRLRAAVIWKNTALAAREERVAAVESAIPGLPRRLALARKVESLVNRIQDLMRERLRSQWRMEATAPGKAGIVVEAVPDAELRAKSVLCVGRDESAATVAQQVVERAGGQFMHHDGGDQGQEAGAALEASLLAADLVICQTGCVSHNAYWRVQDHCKRTGKQCVLVEQPQAMLFVRSADAVVAPAVFAAQEKSAESVRME
ncbi:MAG: DUF2325 domain-containing protein [Comamonadaceae bacterium]|nr:MAG: DUF2325 domain-containing protein [Comamonadaceae bacterium]